MNKNIVIKTEDILAAHAEHGNDFLILDLESMRKHQELAQYFSFKIKLASGRIESIRYWNLSGAGVTISSRVKKPEQRRFEQLCVGVSLNDTEGEESPNGTALKLICTAFEENISKWIQMGILAPNKPGKLSPVKLEDGTEVKPVKLLNTDIKVPMQTFATSRDELDEDGDFKQIELENPYFWLSVPKKKFYKDGKAPEQVQFDGKFYMKNDGTEDRSRPIYVHEYQPEFYNIDDFTVNTSTMKRVFKKIAELDNTNIHEYLTRGSGLVGPLKLEMLATKTVCKLDIMLMGKTYLKIAESSDAEGGSQGNEEVDEFVSRYGALSIKPKNEDFELEENED